MTAKPKPIRFNASNKAEPDPELIKRVNAALKLLVQSLAIAAARSNAITGRDGN
ncbi:MAG TPA: hypothetical protein VMB05_09405 [Solirubrobacteraceae bacterium]|nr:hypothetical protein [Solirubrobacteraceae bacterium]